MTVINGSKWEIVHIPDKPSIPSLQPTVNVFAAMIDPKDANAVVRKLNQIAPLENLCHVKRVRKQHLEGEKIQLSVILCLACENDDDCIPDYVSELIKSFQLSAFIAKVCKFAAVSKEEWEEQCKLWPTSYHPPTYNIDGITGFSEDDSELVIYFMELAVHMAKFREGQVVNAAIIVDPSTKRVIASACDQVLSQSPPINHTSVGSFDYKHSEAFDFQPSVCRVNNFASSKPNSSPDESGQLYTGVSCLYPWKWAEQKSVTRFWHPLKHAAIVAIESSATRDRHLFPGIGACGGNLAEMENIQFSSMGSPVKRQKINTNVKDQEKLENQADGFRSALVRPYLCTGYDIFLVWEPCTMCAMALVHQRIRRIFFAFPNANDGALGSVNRLQGEKSLNHHYAVFRVLLPETIIDGMNPDDELNTQATKLFV